MRGNFLFFIFLIGIWVNGVLGKTFLQALDGVMRGHASLGYDIVAKRAFNDKSRLIFVAGLEGTGHHAMRSFFDVCVKKSVKQTSAKTLGAIIIPCEGEEVMSKQFMLFDFKQNRMGGLFGTANAHTANHHSFQSELKEVHMRMLNLAQIDVPHLSIVGLSYGNGVENNPSGMFSYPNYDGNDKMLNLPDLVMLAAMSESAKLDLRILVLHRKNVSNMLRSYARRFDLSIHKEALVMLNSMTALQGQLQLLDRKFYHCISYDDLLGMQGSAAADELIEFVHPSALKPFQRDMFAAISVDKKFSAKLGKGTSRASSNATDFQLDYLLWRLERQAALLSKFCQVEVPPRN